MVAGPQEIATQDGSRADDKVHAHPRILRRGFIPTEGHPLVRHPPKSLQSPSPPESMTRDSLDRAHHPKRPFSSGVVRRLQRSIATTRGKIRVVISFDPAFWESGLIQPVVIGGVSRGRGLASEIGSGDEVVLAFPGTGAVAEVG